MPFKKPHQISDPSFIEKDARGGYLIKPRGLNIVWGNDPRYWKITNQGTAELIQVSWLEVSGKVGVKNNQTYAVRFHVEVKQDGFGWNGTEVLVMAKIGKRGQYAYKVANYLAPGKSFTIPRESDSQLEIQVEQNETDLELHFGLYEVWSGKWKGGLEIKKAEVVPI